MDEEADAPMSRRGPEPTGSGSDGTRDKEPS